MGQVDFCIYVCNFYIQLLMEEFVDIFFSFIFLSLFLFFVEKDYDFLCRLFIVSDIKEIVYLMGVLKVLKLDGF